MSSTLPTDAFPQRSHALLSFLETLCRAAGNAILEVRQQGLGVEYKADHSPVTLADKAANQLIVEGLHTAFPDIPIVSEEGKQECYDAMTDYFWLVDPLDGTKGFIRGEDEFTVNIGLIHRGMSVAGAIYAPAKDRFYAGSSHLPAYIKHSACGTMQPMQCLYDIQQGHSVLVSKHHLSPKMANWLEDYTVAETIGASSSYKFCLIAEGRASLYPRLGPTMEWDTAAGHAILEAAGGRMQTLDGQPFCYGKPDYLNAGFLAQGHR